MALSDRRARSAENRAAILERKMERAKNVTNEILNSDTFKAQLMGVPEAPAILDKVVTGVVQAVADPVNDYIDTLTARGFNDPVQRRITRNLATAFGLASEDSTHEERVKAVANWIVENPWAYDSLDNYN